MDNEQKRNDLATLQAKLAERKGTDLWRGIEEISETAEFNRWLDDEFPSRSTIPNVDRRDFLKFMGASMLLAGLSGCRFLPKSHIVPHVIGPEDRVTGVAVHYASSFVQDGFATGVLVKSYEGRPLKIEGNPLHPASLGATDATMQACMHTMYDPDRAKAVTYRNEPSTWSQAVGEFRKYLTQSKAGDIPGVAILTPTFTSPTMAVWMRKFVAQTGAKWYQYDAVGRDAARDGVRLAFGDDATPVYNFARANVVFSLDADFFSEGPGHVRHTKDFAERRKVHGDTAELNRVYAVESTPNLVGAFADNKAHCKASEVRQVAEALASAIGIATGGAAPASVGDAFVRQAANELLANRGACLVVPGEHQPKEVHALAHAMNVFLGNAGLTVSYVEPVEADTKNGVLSLARLVETMGAGRVGVLFVLGGNPAYDAPADYKFAEALGKVEHTVHMGVYVNETSALCDWHLPEAYFLEAWGDARAFDGTASIIQPLIEPLYAGRSHLELLSALCNQPMSGYDMVKDTWTKERGLSLADWNKALHDGLIPETASRELAVMNQPMRLDPAPQTNGIEIIFRPDPTIGDGFWANNGWLQELPKPLTKTTWDNCLYVSPKTAEELKLNIWRERDPDNPQHDLAEITVGGASVKAPVFIQPGHPDGAVTLHLGYGRTRAGAIGDGHGCDAYKLRTSQTMAFAGGVELKVVGKAKVANTQYHHSMHGRDIVRYGSVDKYKEDPTLAPPGLMHHGGHGEDKDRFNLFREGTKDHAWDGHKWAMVIDLGLCVGCNACVSACNVENNIAVVGKEQVINGREMHWIRIDRYYGSRDGAANLSNPATHFMPLNCMHCEMAPCEPVCPVAATVHSHEGLNMMVYNRCVGTRYCSNNCPYKVRRFNFLYFTKQYEKPSLKMLMNPDVTVRSRGVMEKCTYCVQRINAARIEEKKSGVAIKDGDVVTACQQACPTSAILFGDIADPNSRISHQRHEKRNYALLEELGTRPRTTYMAKVTNPNTEIETA